MSIRYSVTLAVFVAALLLGNVFTKPNMYMPVTDYIQFTGLYAVVGVLTLYSADLYQRHKPTLAVLAFASALGIWIFGSLFLNAL